MSRNHEILTVLAACAALAGGGCWGGDSGTTTTPAGSGAAPAPAAAPTTHSHAPGEAAHTHGPGETHSHGPTLPPEEARRRTAEAAYLADLGSVHLNHGRIDKAVETLEQAVAMSKDIADNALFYYALGKAYQAKNDAAGYTKNLNESVRIYNALFTKSKEGAAKDDPRNIPNRNFWCEKLSELHRELGDQPKAIEWADQLGSEGDPDSGALRVRARLYVQNGLTAKALAVLEDAEKRAMPGMGRERASFEVADVLVIMKRFDDAVARLQALTETASEPGLRDAAKRLLFKIYDAKGELDKLRLGGGEGAAPKDSPGGEKPAGGGGA